MRKLPEREAMTHRQWARPYEALPTRSETQTFDRPPGGIRPIEHPHFFLVRCRRFEHVTEGRNERIDAAAEVLKVDEQDVERIHHLRRRTAHVSVQTEHRNAVARVVKRRGLDHVVLLIAAQPMLRS